MKENLQKISRAVVAVTGISLKDIKSKSRDQPKVFARMLLACCASKTYGISQKDIADFLKVEQPTVNHYLKTIQEEFARNKALQADYNKINLHIFKKQPAARKPQAKIDYSAFPILCEKSFGIKPVAELKFHPKRRWRFDFAFPEKKLAIEVEGAVWTNGRHTRGSGFLGDMEKYNESAALGWRILRTTPNQLETEQFISLINKTLQQNFLP